MQHAVGAPLPPPEGSRGPHGQATGGWAHGSPPHGPPPGAAAPYHGPPAPHGHQPVPGAVPYGARPAPGGHGDPQGPHGQPGHGHGAPPPPGAAHPPGGLPPTGPPHLPHGAPGAPVPPQGPPAPPPPDVTGHVRLPPGGPVPLPVPHPAEGGTGAATLAVLLIGPAGAGKTTVARHWAATRQVPTAHISLDDVREWVCSGFADPQSGWNEHSEAQYRLARRTCGFAARNFLANGISCILDDAVFPDRPVVGLGGWKRHVGPGLLPVVLLPGLEIVLERNAERSGNRRLSDEEVAGIHGRMAGWYGSGLPIIDNSKYDVETTARVLDDVLARSIASPPAW
ncbi:ATP-binding protein [Streptomyces sp. NBC_01498]|uniref:AAA family ATPase n=1 Tax=Streptomyces sp. NBC_01498 TaxID=2975870 RepID=UPI002E7BDB07|nr:AAA family ATPase [Streptomyces sp. NBC_01498]WTL27859.1 ATP-binding protein [Streptomyces sp. NBC_01498]